MTIDDLIAHFGLPAIFLGAALQGEAASVAGGIVAHRQLIPLWEVVGAVYAGTLIFAQLLFHTARWFRDSPWLARQTARRACAGVVRAVERRPISYLLIYRFVPGTRVLTPLVAGGSRVPVIKFTLLNLVAAALWSTIFIGIGYGFGNTVEQLFGRLRSGPHLVLMGGLTALIVVAGYAANRRSRRRALPGAG